MLSRLTTIPAGWRAAAIALALLPPVAALAAAPSAGLSVRIANQPSSFKSAPQSLVFEINGHAARICTPTIASASVVGAEIDLRLHLPSSGCAQERQFAFNLTADIAALTGRALPRGPVYHVQVRDQNAELLAFRVFETASGSAGPLPENGFWWPQNADGSGTPIALGSGIGIEAQGSQLAVSLFGFNELGSPTWYFGSTRQKGRVASIDLLELQNGEPLFAGDGRQPAARPGPHLDIEFESSSQARAWLIEGNDGANLKLRAFDLARTPFARSTEPAPYLVGRWVLVSDAEAAPRELNLSQRAGTSATDAQLGDDEVDAKLTCHVDPIRHTATLCSLTVAGIVLADFDRIGIDRLVGHGNDGARVQLLRVPQTK